MCVIGLLLLPVFHANRIEWFQRVVQVNLYNANNRRLVAAGVFDGVLLGVLGWRRILRLWLRWSRCRLGGRLNGRVVTPHDLGWWLSLSTD